MVKPQTSDIRMTYEYIRVTYGWHTSTYEWHTGHIRVHTSNIRLHKSDIRTICGHRILSNSAALSNSTASLIIPLGFFTFKIYLCLSNSPAFRVWYSRVWHRPYRVLTILQLQRNQCIAEFRMFLILLLCRTHFFILLYLILSWWFGLFLGSCDNVSYETYFRVSYKFFSSPIQWC